MGRGNVIVIAGPTASGKSALAIDVARAFGGDVVNADSMQLYREMNVITARPDADALARAPHRLYGALTAAETCSAGRWRGLAVAEIDDVLADGRTPVVVGGTGLYLRALISGLSPIPPVPNPIRAAARARHEEIGGPAFHAALATRDPNTAARLSPGDSQRLIRAWEVLEATGRSLSDWQAAPEQSGSPGYRFFRILILPPRETTYEACDNRFDHMIAHGALDEARAVAALGLDPALPAMKAVGLRPLMRCAAGEISVDEARMLGQRETRRYAKRQSTWFRHQMAPDHTIFEQYSESIREQIFSKISNFGLTAIG